MRPVAFQFGLLDRAGNRGVPRPGFAIVLSLENSTLNAWLVRKSGLLAGTRHLLREEVSHVGRGSANDVVVTESAVVSARHIEIERQGDRYVLRDLDSTNGTFLDGNRITEATLTPPCSIRLGKDGPEFNFVIDDTQPLSADQTLVASSTMAIPEAFTLKPDAAVAAAEKEHEKLLASAVAQARHARRTGLSDATVVIMREMLQAALGRTRRRFRTVIALLVAALVGVSAYGFWKIEGLKTDKHRIDADIQKIEKILESTRQDSPQAEELADELDKYQDQARALESTLLYRATSFEREESVKREIRALLAEFGAETYSIPPEFLDQVKRFIEQYQGPDRPHMERAMGAASKQMGLMRRIFQENNLPPDLAYVVLVESGLSARESSTAGAAGLWQFTPATARAFGLKVNDSVDERLNTAKSTRAASKYMRELILDFGSGSSVMLALAAYNLGPTKVKSAVRKVSDPIKQRNFWYLYRVRAIPPETREYVPKVIAVMLIARHPERYGFEDQSL